jgi:predicted nucleotidyltransferase
MQLDLQVIPPWLDEETSALVREKAELLAQRHPDVIAIILYGSVARHEERSLDVPDPSDVDLLVVLNGNRDAVRSQILALVHTAGLAGPGLHRQCEARWQNPLSARRASCPFRRLKHRTATPTANPTPTPSTIGSTGPALATRLPARATTWQTPLLLL